ncbi:hypothetical protein TTHERM_000992671 (macronuclear) [Tetrahymena thermophila SB210]|uniref:Uncharacterized protein n=1 Tax=Tetrahymena thermophila (strain SB210) TaxID=312017 RepID=W7WXZ0_TETTS|nr:hypothetical protein TTHERM_000992671 [Tetrahymena thermophila SB210]EWS71725.1 hypothetical protein TTHERM_000992671 [Tetrahymena thermophila SB210]|eukprot:XP_012655733.1 hypothetical protein TTHERM_000992671 [Tetrahymena thermophila SB210]
MEFPLFDAEENGDSNSEELQIILNENIESNQEKVSRGSSTSLMHRKKNIQKKKKNAMNCTDLVCKEYLMQNVSQIRWKTVKNYNIFFLSFDFIFDLDGQGKLDDSDYWSERSNFLQNYRPTCKIQRFDQYSVYYINNSITGITDYSVPIKILEKINNQFAFKMINALKYTQQQFQQLDMLNTKLKSIFSASYLKEKLDSNFEKSFSMAQDIAKQLIANNNEYFVLIVLRMCPETLTYKAQMIIKSLKLLKLTSLDNINLLDRLALKQRLPYLIDPQTQLDLCVNFMYDDYVYESTLLTINEDIIPCLLETKKAYLSSCEISKGIFLPDICIIEKFTINPNIINALLSENYKKNQKYLIYDLEECNEQANQFINKYYTQNI